MAAQDYNKQAQQQIDAQQASQRAALQSQQQAAINAYKASKGEFDFSRQSALSDMDRVNREAQARNANRLAARGIGYGEGAAAGWARMQGQQNEARGQLEQQYAVALQRMLSERDSELAGLRGQVGALDASRIGLAQALARDLEDRGYDIRDRNLAYDQSRWNFGEQRRTQPRMSDLQYNQANWQFGQDQQWNPLMSKLAYDRGIWELAQLQGRAAGGGGGGRGYGGGGAGASGAGGVNDVRLEPAEPHSVGDSLNAAKLRATQTHSQPFYNSWLNTAYEMRGSANPLARLGAWAPYIGGHFARGTANILDAGVGGRGNELTGPVSPRHVGR